MYKMKFSQSYITSIVISIVILVGCSSSRENMQSAEESESNPNIVFILSDDQSWTDYGFMGHPHIETPNIDDLASQGLTFTRGYLPAPVCRPSLASLVTGLYPHQHGVTGNDPGFEFDKGSSSRSEWLEARKPVNDVVTDRFNELSALTDYLSELGYLSLQTGKWWEGSWQDGGFTHGMTHGDPARGGRHGDDGLTIGREGMQPIEDFMDEAQQKERPFFIWYAPFMPHTPHTPPDSLLKKYLPNAPSESIAKYWAMVDWFDITVGQLLDSIEDRGLTENTIVVYLSDNGWIQDPKRENRYMPRSKLSSYDMGMRTPMIYKWPRRIAPRMDTTTFVSSLDVVPTVLQAVELEPTDEMQGVNVLDLEKLYQRSAIFSQSFTHDIADVDHPAQSLKHRMIMKSPWKLIIPSPIDTQEFEYRPEYRQKKEPGLYHIVDDPYERQNLALERPGVARELRQELNSWWKPDF